jgi:hypothetical protein
MSSREFMKRLKSYVYQTWKATPRRRKWYRDLMSGRLLQKKSELSSSCGSRRRLKILRPWKVRKVRKKARCGG